jgi:N-methylhydantoinase B
MATTNMTNRIINAVQRAFSDLGEGYGLAEGAASMGGGFAVISGRDSRFQNAPYINQLLLGNNGGPAAASCDGWVTYGMPDCAATVLVDSVEVIEKKYPIYVRSARLLVDSGGAGRYRGAPASEVVYGPRDDLMSVAYFAEMHQVPAQGTRDGHAGQRSRVSIIRADGTIEALPPIGLVDLSPGECIVSVEGGGGGYGSPLTREPRHVLNDVLERWVSARAARDVYRVVVMSGESSGELVVDEPATQALRKTSFEAEES